MSIINRRNFISGAACIAMSGCAPAVADLEVTATSILYKRFFDVAKYLANAGFSGSVGNGTYDVIKLSYDKFKFLFLPTQAMAAEDKAISWDEIMGFADKNGFQEELVTRMIKTIGKSATLACVKSENPVLIQKCGLKSQLTMPNIFYVHVNNMTANDIGGQLKFDVTDDNTGDIEHRFFSSSFIVPANSNRPLPIRTKFDFSTPGPKTVKIISHPNNLETAGTSIHVAPILST